MLSFIHTKMLVPFNSGPHDDVIKWKHFLRYRPFVRGIHRSPMNSRTKASVAELWCFFDLLLNKLLSKQSLGWWFKTPSHTLWCHCNATQKRRRKLCLLLSRAPGLVAMEIALQYFLVDIIAWAILCINELYHACTLGNPRGLSYTTYIS